jgi:alkanesulfonate monooxygenase SsuD/methylene tetrahydromethanopterin reductase-like flavin-dependent oxidoreductase (luciferase family)
MQFGIFDHLDRAGASLPDFYEGRLKIAEAYDRAGFYAYHLAEHHSTPLGMAPSPNVFLAALAQRTRRLRFGPMVFVVPLYHPLRLISEICMLDQMSGGRLELSFGRGASPIELEYFGADPASAQDIYNEAVEVILTGLTHKTLDFHGKHFSFDNVPMELAPLQKPHPPIWYGAHAPDSAARAARAALNIINLDATAEVHLTVASYRKAWNETWNETWKETKGAAAPLPKIGLGRFIVVAETDAQAMRLASRAYTPWHQSFTYLPRLLGRSQTHPRPAEFGALMERGQGVAGSPATVRTALAEQLAETGCNYVVGQFAFGDMTCEEALHSIGLFASEVMPALRNVIAAPSAASNPESIPTGW